MGKVTITFEDTDIEEGIFSVDLDGVPDDDIPSTDAEAVGMFCFLMIQDKINEMMSMGDGSGLEPWYPEGQDEYDALNSIEDLEDLAGDE